MMNFTKFTLWLGLLIIFSSYEILAKEVKILIRKKESAIHAPAIRYKRQFLVDLRPVKKVPIKKRKAKHLRRKAENFKKIKIKLAKSNDLRKHSIDKQKFMMMAKVKKKATPEHIKTRAIKYEPKIQTKYHQIPRETTSIIYLDRGSYNPSDISQAESKMLVRFPTLKRAATQKRIVIQQTSRQSEMLAAGMNLREATDKIIATYRGRYENLKQKEKQLGAIRSPRKQAIAKKVFNKLLKDLEKNIEDFRVEMAYLLTEKATDKKIEEASLHFQTVFNAGGLGIDTIISWGHASRKKEEERYRRFMSRYIEEAEQEVNNVKVKQNSRVIGLLKKFQNGNDELFDGLFNKKKKG